MHFSALVKWEHHTDHADTQVYIPSLLLSGYEPFRIMSLNLRSVRTSLNCSSATCLQIFLHRNTWLCSILFNQLSHCFEVPFKISALLTHQLLDTISRSYNRICVCWKKQSRFTKAYSAHETSSNPFQFMPITWQLDCLEDCWDELRNSLCKSSGSSGTYCILTVLPQNK